VKVGWKSVPGGWTGVEKKPHSPNLVLVLGRKAAEPVDLSRYLPLAAETVDTRSDRYFGASPMWM